MLPQSFARRHGLLVNEDELTRRRIGKGIFEPSWNDPIGFATARTDRLPAATRNGE